MLATTNPAGRDGLLQPALDALPPDDDWAIGAVETLLVASRQLGCSDLHLFSRGGGVTARGRREGDFVDLGELPAARRDILIARLKILARLPTFVRHEPQDGRIDWTSPGDGEAVLLRVSFLPTIHGESVVIRFPESRVVLELDALGMDEPVLDAVRRLLARPEGTILLTGPSSSGKTSTLYAMLAHLMALHGDRLNFLTIEDPVERDLGFACQVQVDEAKGLTFERSLRAALRQDPNVLMIGEIRDHETARTALQAGMTGHLVLSTLHAGRSNLVFSRLLSIGVSRFLVASALTGVIAQRLVRLLCPACRSAAAHRGFHAVGCAECNHTGHAGRAGIFELVTVTESLRSRILAEAGPEQIAAIAAQSRVGSLPARARALALQGEIDRRECELLFAACEDADDPACGGDLNA